MARRDGGYLRPAVDARLSANSIDHPSSISQQTGAPMTAIKPFKPLDEKFPFDRQLGIAAAPLVLINLFTVVDPADEAGFGRFGGCRSHNEAPLHFHATTSAIGDSPTYLNYVAVGIHEAVRAPS
jgi:hypothetical protein